MTLLHDFYSLYTSHMYIVFMIYQFDIKVKQWRRARDFISITEHIARLKIRRLQYINERLRRALDAMIVKRDEIRETLAKTMLKKWSKKKKKKNENEKKKKTEKREKRKSDDVSTLSDNISTSSDNSFETSFSSNDHSFWLRIKSKNKKKNNNDV